MKIFLLICLASGLASSEKLDRTYLPPPGSKFSGGNPGDLETPLEFPKQPTGPQLPGPNGPQLPGKPEIELGINRRPALPEIPDGQKPGFTYFQNSYPVPKTTTTYAITQTTTFSPADDEGIDPNVFNGTTIQTRPGQNQQPIRGPGRRPGYNQYQPGPGQTSTVAPYGTSARPQFPGIYNGPAYLPPVSSKRPGQLTNQDGSAYPSGLPQGPKYQDGQVSNRPGYVRPGANQQNQYSGNQTPSTVAPQYQDERFIPTGPGSQQSQNQFPGSQFPSSTMAPQYQAGQRLTTPGNQNQFSPNQFPSSTAAPQYQAGQRLNVPGSSQPNQFSSAQDFPSSTAAPQYEFGQRFTTPGQNQQYGTRVPNQNQFTGNQYQGNQNFPTSTASPTPGLIEDQYSGNQNFPSTAAPNYQDGQRFTTSGQIQGGLIPGQQTFGSRVTSQNQFVGQNFPTSTTAPQYQDSQRLSTPGYVQEGYSPVPSQQNQNQYPGSQNYPSSTSAPQYQNGQQFTTPGSAIQNFPSTVAPGYEGGQRFSTPGQYQEQYGPGQQMIGSLIPGQQSQTTGNQNYPLSTAAPQYHDSQRFSTPGTRDRFEAPQLNQQNQYNGNQNLPTSTTGPQSQYDQQRFTSPGSEQSFGPQQQNQYGNQNFPTSTVPPQYQGQRFTTPGQLFNQPTAGSTAAPQYQQTLAPTQGSNQPGVPYQQNQYKQPGLNQQYPSSTVAPQGFIPGSQPQYGTNIASAPGTEVVIPESQGAPGSQIYGNNQQATSQTGAPVSGSPSVPARFPNQGFPSTTAGPQPTRDFGSTPGFGAIGGVRQERPQAEGDRNAEILSYENVLTPEGYSYSYDTSNGIHADETGTVGDGTRAQGGYSYISDDGKVYSVVYSADENGFQPRGDHLPTPPPIPEAIQRVIDQANKDKESGIDDDGSYDEKKYGYMNYEGPLRRMRPKNRTVSLVNGADIPDVTRTRIGEQKKKTYKAKGSKPGSKPENDKDFKSGLEETDIFDSETDDVEEDCRDYVDLDRYEKPNRRISAKRPKPMKNLTVEDNRDRSKEPTRPITNSKTMNEKFDGNNLNQRPILPTEDDESAIDTIAEEPEDNDDSQESQGSDYDSDLVNYRDDPNNRTDFHGLNKYLPESKQMNRKNQSAKKRPMVRVKGTKRPVDVGETETTIDSDDQVPQGERLGYDGEKRMRIPSRKNKIGQKSKSMSKTTGQSMNRDSDDEMSRSDDDVADQDEEYDTDGATKSVTKNRVSKPGSSQSKKIISGMRKKPNINEANTPDNKGNIPTTGQETGYEYTPPQRQFEDSGKFPSRPSTQKGSPTTLRPFMTKNVYGDETESAEEYDQFGGVKPGRPIRPMSGQKYPAYNENADGYNQNPETTDGERFSTTRRPVSYGTSRRPIGTESTGAPQYQDQGVTGQVYNEPSIQTQRPGDKVFYNTNAPSRGTPGNVFSSTTPLPPSGPDSAYQRPGQSRPSDGSNYEVSSPGEEYVNGAYRPSGQVPSTTYRPNYSFGDKISTPVTVDGFGRPIQSTNAPAFDRTLRPNYSTARPTDAANILNDVNRFKPSEGGFGATSTQGPPGYQSTSAPIGEDFSGPQQPQRYDPETGYHYK